MDVEQLSKREYLLLVWRSMPSEMRERLLAQYSNREGQDKAVAHEMLGRRVASYQLIRRAAIQAAEHLYITRLGFRG